MKEFNPDEYLTEIGAGQNQPAPTRTPNVGGFDPDAYLAEVYAPIGRPVEAIIQNAGQAVSGNYLPHIQAATEPYIQKGLDFLLGDNVDEKLKEQGFKIQNAPEESYVDRRDKNIQYLDKLTTENPWASRFGTGIGAVSSAFGLGGVVGNTAKAANVAQKASLANKIYSGVKGGTAIGALMNPGDVEGVVDPIQLKERAANSVFSGAIGGAIPLGIAGVGKVGEVIKNAPETLKKFSQLKSLKSSGAMLKDFRRAFGSNKAYELGQEAIDNRLVSVGDDIADVAAKSKIALAKVGGELDDVYKSADASTKVKINKEDIRKVYDDYSSGAAERLKGISGGKQVAEKMQSELDTLLENEAPTFREMQRFRSSIDDKITYSKANKDLPIVEKELKVLRGKIQSMVRRKMGEIDPKLTTKFDGTNRKFSNIITIEQMARDKAAREASNAAFGLRESIYGGAGGAAGATIGTAVGGPIGGMIGGLAGAGTGAITTKLARKYAGPLIANVANKVARGLEKNPKLFGAPGEALMKAANNSPKEFVNSVNIYWSDPEFKRKVKNLK